VRADATTRTITLERPPTIHIGAGTAAGIGRFARARGIDRALVIASPFNADRIDRLGLACRVELFAGFDGEPDIATLTAARAVADRFQPELVVGFGGGSAMDLAKLVAVLSGSALAIDDVVGVGRTPARTALLAQVPTTAGTGSEAGTRALVSDLGRKTKLAVESPEMLADLVALDPTLAVTLPPAITAETGVDALAHCVEAFTSARAHPAIDFYALEGIRLIGRYLHRAVAHSDDLEARAGMAMAALYGGYCLGPVNTTAGHAIAYPLSTRHGVAHGRANAIIFPAYLRVQRRGGARADRQDAGSARLRSDRYRRTVRCRARFLSPAGHRHVDACGRYRRRRPRTDGNGGGVDPAVARQQSAHHHERRHSRHLRSGGLSAARPSRPNPSAPKALSGIHGLAKPVL
jgi:alcohol dehydrogenase class IV